MFRTDVTTASVTLPTPATPGTPGYFTNGNPATGSPATIVDQDWLNRIQEELMTFVTAAGYTASKTNYQQVANSIQSGSLNFAADSSGTANEVVVTLAPVPPAYKQGLSVYVLIANTNTGATNVNVNGLGNKAVYANGAALVGGELQVGSVAHLVYNGTQFQILSVYASNTRVVFIGGTSTGTANAQVVATATGNFTLSVGNIVTWKAGYTNTGAMTLAVDGTTATTVKKKLTTGIADLAAGDITVGEEYMAQYDGTNFQLMSIAGNPSAYLQTANALSELSGVASTARSNIGALGSLLVSNYAVGSYAKMCINSGAPISTAFTVGTNYSASTIQAATASNYNTFGPSTGTWQCTDAYLQSYGGWGGSNSLSVFNFQRVA